MHTPGPWEIQSLGVTHNGYEWPTFAVRSPRNICLAVIGDVDRASAPDNTANARLIAAAPEMLELIQSLVNFTALEEGSHHLQAMRDFLTRLKGA
jgi:hypothetical protein